MNRDLPRLRRRRSLLQPGAGFPQPGLRLLAGEARDRGADLRQALGELGNPRRAGFSAQLLVHRLPQRPAQLLRPVRGAVHAADGELGERSVRCGRYGNTSLLEQDGREPTGSLE